MYIFMYITKKLDQQATYMLMIMNWYYSLPVLAKACLFQVCLENNKTSQINSVLYCRVLLCIVFDVYKPVCLAVISYMI